MTEEFQKKLAEGKELYKQLDEIQESLTNAIYIDGVDVAGCHFLEKILGYQPLCRLGLLGNDNSVAMTCSNCKDCYYKQLMFANKKLEAAKAETEKLVSTIWIMSGEITDLRNEKERLHNELIEAKGEQLGTLIRYNKILERITEYIDSNYGLTTFHIQDIVNIINEAIK